MPSQPSEHTDGQLQLGWGDGIGPSPYPAAQRFQVPCLDTGPYVWERYTPWGRKTYVAMKCNRSRHQSGDHQWADDRSSVRFVWGVDGRPIFPLPIPSEVTNHANP